MPRLDKQLSFRSADDAKKLFSDMDSQELKPIFKVDCMRYVQLLSYCMLTISSYVSWTCMSPIGYQVSKNYSVGLVVVNSLPAMLAIVEICLSLPAAHFIEKHGSSKTILVVSALNTIGFCIKLLTNTSFYWNLIGQIFPSIAAQIVLQASTKFAATWFGPNERVIAVSLIVIA